MSSRWCSVSEAAIADASAGVSNSREFRLSRIVSRRASSWVIRSVSPRTVRSCSSSRFPVTSFRVPRDKGNCRTPGEEVHCRPDRSLRKASDAGDSSFHIGQWDVPVGHGRSSLFIRRYRYVVAAAGDARRGKDSDPRKPRTPSRCALSEAPGGGRGAHAPLVRIVPCRHRG
jgi:hypothetical protein